MVSTKIDPDAGGQVGIAIGLALLAVGCGSPEVARDAAEIDSAVNQTDWFTPTEECGSGPVRAPSVGAEFHTQIIHPDGTEGSQVLYTVVARSGAIISLSSERTFPSGETHVDQFTTRVAAGFLPAGMSTAGSSLRTVTFALSPAEALSRLTPGERLKLPVSEQTDFEGSRRTIDDHYQIELLACGRVHWNGGEEAVRVYRAETFNRAYRAGTPPTDIVRRNISTYYVSDRLGWPLRQVDEGSGGSYLTAASRSGQEAS